MTEIILQAILPCGLNIHITSNGPDVKAHQNEYYYAVSNPATGKVVSGYTETEQAARTALRSTVNEIVRQSLVHLIETVDQVVAKHV